MKKWKCTICSYIHVGDNPPDVCPECGVGPEFFEEIAGGEAEPENKLAPEEREAAKQAIYKISYGLYIVGSPKGEKINAQVCNTVFQITSEPMRVAIGINKGNLTAEHIQASGVFSVNILGMEAHSLVRRFGYRSGREFDKFKGIKYTAGKTGAPLLQDCLGYLECQVLKDKVVDCGTHWLFVADVVGGKLLENADPMTYDYYRKTK
ncbi:flavin reductase family protein [Zhaonella formicivorans]|jgi:flavin reductase (DIM6/NTAB) family NADH-FMN oxidoreductase RutF/rubredoxin|uniref:flavin reductase family protein n=1 Tax=Zhaonella formicivorans TaxID=2528593 RepID=UPI0010ED22A0|nr:flavin reductase [Zhaonella formicivorans]